MMKTFTISAIILLTNMKLFGQGDAFKLPKEWEKTFTISVSHTGSTSGSESRLMLTHDSCAYVTMSRQDAPTEKKFALSQKDRVAILMKMNELKADKIKAGRISIVQNDGWSNLLCFESHCIEGGSATDMTQNDKAIFVGVCHYLEEFAITR